MCRFPGTESETHWPIFLYVARKKQNKTKQNKKVDRTHPLAMKPWMRDPEVATKVQNKFPSTEFHHKYEMNMFACNPIQQE